jgi:hypothetical protein
MMRVSDDTIVLAWIAALPAIIGAVFSGLAVVMGSRKLGEQNDKIDAIHKVVNSTNRTLKENGKDDK